MACVTLKRPVEVLGSPHRMESEPMVKRRRCGMSLFPTTPPGSASTERHMSPTPTLARHHSLCGSPLSANRGTKRAKRKLDIDDYSISTPSTPPPVSPFLHATPPIETDKLVTLHLERLHHLKQSDQPLFTLKQVTLVCQRMMKEREEMIRSEYDKVLTTKLAEQYDTFVKFSHDQIEKRLAESEFSYVS